MCLAMWPKILVVQNLRFSNDFEDINELDDPGREEAMKGDFSCF